MQADTGGVQTQAWLPRLAPETSAIMNVVRRPADGPPPKSRVHRSLNDVVIPSVYNTYPPPLSTDVEITQRKNPLRPPPPQRRTCVWETHDPNWENEKRRHLMAKRDYHRYHQAWSRYYYGNPAEKELYNRFMREGLKQQMMEREQNRSLSLKERMKECQVAVQRDRDDIDKDLQSARDKHTFLTQYRDANKQMMEEAEQRRRAAKSHTDYHDREILRYNPINWSASLK